MEHSKKEMIAFEKALEMVLTSVKLASTQQVKLQNSLDRVLAEDIYSDIDMPPFNKSAMDGFACRLQDLSNELEIVDEIPAGAVPSKTVRHNQCARIMTGAVVPGGADFVLMKEYAKLIDSNKIRCTNETTKSNICYKGEDVKKGDLVLKKGILLAPSHIAILASVGKHNPLVYMVPHVAIISTGNELVEPYEIPEPVQIRNSNSYQLVAQLMKIGIPSDYLGIVEDNEQAVHDIMVSALSKYDVIIISGGVSVGDYDFVPAVLNQLGARIIVHGMKVKPGKHLLIASLDNKTIIGLPGNPVSSYVQFEVFVKQVLFNMMGCSHQPNVLNLPIAEDYSRQKTDQLLFIPVRFSATGTVILLEYHGSAHIHSITKADGIMEIPVAVSEIKKGEPVRVRPL
jgi:molybdopterin molybdotransferase